MVEFGGRSWTVGRQPQETILESLIDEGREFDLILIALGTIGSFKQEGERFKQGEVSLICSASKVKQIPQTICFKSVSQFKSPF